jgi:hypothetical protein
VLIPLLLITDQHINSLFLKLLLFPGPRSSSMHDQIEEGIRLAIKGLGTNSLQGQGISLFLPVGSRGGGKVWNGQ